MIGLRKTILFHSMISGSICYNSKGDTVYYALISVMSYRALDKWEYLVIIFANSA